MLMVQAHFPLLSLGRRHLLISDSPGIAMDRTTLQVRWLLASSSPTRLLTCPPIGDVLAVKLCSLGSHLSHVEPGKDELVAPITPRSHRLRSARGLSHLIDSTVNGMLVV